MNTCFYCNAECTKDNAMEAGRLGWVHDECYTKNNPDTNEEIFSEIFLKQLGFIKRKIKEGEEKYSLIFFLKGKDLIELRNRGRWWELHCKVRQEPITVRDIPQLIMGIYTLGFIFGKRSKIREIREKLGLVL